MKPRPTLKLSTIGSIEYRRLMGIVRRVRNRWRVKILLRGLGISLLTGLVTVALAAWGVDAFRFRPAAVIGLGLMTYGVLGIAVYRFIVRPLVRRVSDAQVALYIEEHAKLDGAMLSAVEFGSPGHGQQHDEVSSLFVEKIVERAVNEGASIDYGSRIDRGELRRVSGFLGIASMAVVAVLLVNPAFLRLGVPRLLSPWGAATAESPYRIGLSPGSAEVARGGSQKITAELSGFEAEVVEISFKTGAGDWDRATMNADAHGYSFVFFDLEATTEYFVEASGVRTALYRLDVVDLPYVDHIELELVFPDYSGLSPQTIEDAGDIAALAGSRARLRIVPTITVPKGQLRLERVRPSDTSVGSNSPEGAESPTADVQNIPMRPVGDAFELELTLDAPGYYRVDLEGYDGKLYEASPEYIIELLHDQPPVLTLEAPGRDITVNAVDEVFTEVSAEDDFGLASMQLVWSLNGGDERAVSLLPHQKGADLKQASGSHTFYLEEMELEPGDFISYYARATDNRGGAQPQRSSTDIYFMQVMPYRRDYRQASSGGGGGGSGQPQVQLGERQRQVVAATFKLVRDQGAMDPQRFAKDLALVGEVQGQVRRQTLQAVSRIDGRQGDMMQAVEYLRTAATEMEDAAAKLGQQQPQEALRPEQRALQQLQRLEAMMRQMQVAMQQGGGGAGGDLDRIADALDSEELDNQYESVQRQRQEAADNEVDEALQRLTELSRRQQQEIERQRAQAGGQRGQGGAQAQREIAGQAENLARQLERLARQESRKELQEAANRLRQSVDAMRRAAASRDQGKVAEGARALSELQNARRLLDASRSGRLRRDLGDVQKRAEQLRAQQQGIEREVERLGAPGGRTAERLDRLLQSKDALSEEIDDLEGKIDRMARSSRAEQMETSRGLQEAAEWIRDSKLSDKVRYSKGVVQERDPRYADNFEAGISEDLENLDERVDAAAGALRSSEADRLADALEGTRDLVRKLESLEQRARDTADDPQEQGAQVSAPRQGEQGQQGEQGRRGEQGADAGGQAREGGRLRTGRVGGSANAVPGRRQLDRELEERVRDAEQLRQALRDEGIQTTDLDAIVDALQQVEPTERGLDQLRDDVIDNLKLFEFWLRRLTDADEGRLPQLTGSGKVPERYRRLVEEYFRALARDSAPRR